MSFLEWMAGRYGDPCRECGFGWDVSVGECVALVRHASDRCLEVLGDADPDAKHPDLGWSVREYACHMTDNLRIWSERLAGAALGGPTTVAWYDADLLAQARVYSGVPLEGILWAMPRAVRDWVEAVVAADEANVTLTHPERGRLTVADIVRGNAHDAHHHMWDIERSIAACTMPD